MYNSEKDTKEHITLVRENLYVFQEELKRRGDVHDRSKLESPEKETFDRLTPILKDLAYGSPEYKESLKELGTALQHHYKVNDHHPEHFEDGIFDMNLFQIIEMFCDWQAAVKRTKDGNLLDSIEQNKSRFKMDNQLYSIFINTANKIKNDNRLQDGENQV